MSFKSVCRWELRSRFWFAWQLRWCRWSPWALVFFTMSWVRGILSRSSTEALDSLSAKPIAVQWKSEWAGANRSIESRYGLKAVLTIRIQSGSSINSTLSGGSPFSLLGWTFHSPFRASQQITPCIARVAELADAQDLKSCDRKVVRVQVPPRVLACIVANAHALKNILSINDQIRLTIWR